MLAAGAGTEECPDAARNNPVYCNVDITQIINIPADKILNRFSKPGCTPFPTTSDPELDSGVIVDARKFTRNRLLHDDLTILAINVTK